MNNSVPPAAFLLQIQVTDDCCDAPSCDNLQTGFADCLAALVATLPDNQAASLRNEICVRLCGEKESQQMNKRFRDRDKPTNVLSFAALTDTQCNPIKISGELGQQLPELPLGDLAICWPVVLHEAQEQAKAVSDHLKHLFLHGVLHLLGFDHAKPVEAEVMEQLECEALLRLNISNPYINDGEKV